MRINLDIHIGKGKIKECKYSWKKPTKKELEAVEMVLEEFHKDIKKSKDMHE